MRTDSVKKYVIPNIPYLFILWACLKLGTAYRLAPGADFAHKLMGLGQSIGPAFADFAPGLAPFDWLIGIVGAVGFRLLIYFKSKNAKKYRRDAEYGSARWGTAADIAPFLHEKASENIPLTATESLSLAMKMPVTAENNYNRNKNVIVFGPSGSGKSYSVAGPQLLQFNSNYVLSDPKGELLDTYGNVLVSQGYDVKVFNLKDRDKSDHYNPFAYIHDTDDIVVVAKNLIKNMKEDPRQKNTADPIWEEGSTSLLEALLAYVYFEQPPEMHNMNSVMELFVLMQHRYGPQGRSQLDDIFEDLAMEKPASFAARQYGLYHMAPDKTAQSIDVSLGMRMSAFNIPSIMKICEDDTIHLEELASDKKVALFVVTPDTTTAYNFLAAVMFQLSDSCAYRRQS